MYDVNILCIYRKNIVLQKLFLLQVDENYFSVTENSFAHCYPIRYASN